MVAAEGDRVLPTARMISRYHLHLAPRATSFFSAGKTFFCCRIY